MSGAFRLLRSTVRGEAGAWNHHRAVAAEEQTIVGLSYVTLRRSLINLFPFFNKMKLKDYLLHRTLVE